MTQKEIEVAFFDINGKYEEDEDEDEIDPNVNLLESPIKIIKYFSKNKELINFSEDSSSPSEIKYEFSFKEKKFTLFCDCLVISDLSYIHSNILNADAYVIFFNLEELNVYEKLEKIISYMKESCSLTVTMFFIGVYNKEIIEENNEQNMIKYFDGIEDINYQYIEMLFNESEKCIENKELNIIKVMKNLFMTIKDIKDDNHKIVSENINQDESEDHGNCMNSCIIF